MIIDIIKDRTVKLLYRLKTTTTFPHHNKKYNHNHQAHQNKKYNRVKNILSKEKLIDIQYLQEQFSLNNKH